MSAMQPWLSPLPYSQDTLDCSLWEREVFLKSQEEKKHKQNLPCYSFAPLKCVAVQQSGELSGPSSVHLHTNMGTKDSS